jgi:hypothetical protein
MKRGLPVTGKMIRTSFDIWRKVKAASVQNDKHMKTIMEEIFTGKRDPVTMEMAK